MTNIAILVGNTDYKRQATLACCREDVQAIKELIDATKKYDVVETIINEESARLKDSLRRLIDTNNAYDEVFFYFTGHGFQDSQDFYFCPTDFDASRPNETGLSNSELHVLLKAKENNLVVKVIDACQSGALLIKSDDSILSKNKNSFNKLIQIASCLGSQSSLTGDPLSEFTDNFRRAVLKKREGAVYYSDIINALRDMYLQNDDRTPHFVSQGTGREEFVDDAARLYHINNSLNTAFEGQSVVPAADLMPTTAELLRQAEVRLATMEKAQSFITRLFDKLEAKAAADEFSELFDVGVTRHPDYLEPTSKSFIIKVLVSEKRPDNFVSVTIDGARKQQERMQWLARASGFFWGEETEAAQYKLSLNCQLEAVQTTITLTPKFKSLKRFVLVVSCAPSLDRCYVMEMLTEHKLSDWTAFDPEGGEIIRRWYKSQWDQPCDDLVHKIFDKLRTIVQESVTAVTQSIAQL